MRGCVAGLQMPYELSTMLPAVLQEDEFTMRFIGGLDEVLAPIVSTIDCMEAYLDPMLAPEDFLHWLAFWFGSALDENWPLERRRRAVAAALSLHGRRGTAAGLRVQLEIATGGLVEVTDTGGVTWSTTPGLPLPAAGAMPRVEVRIVVADAGSVDVGALDALINAAKPAHVVHELAVSDA